MNGEPRHGFSLATTNPTRRFVIWLAMMACLAAVALLGGWWFGQVTGSRESAPLSFRVQGSSMVPTLVGSFRTARCDACQLVWLIDVPESGVSGDDLSCAHCGREMVVVLPSAERVAQSDPPFDSVTIESLAAMKRDGRRLALGDLVAVRWGERTHIKRIAAAPGDLVSHTNSRLLVNADRIEDRIVRGSCRFPVPWLLVDDDTRRSQSRWARQEPATGNASATDRSPAWTPIGQGQWLSSARDEDSASAGNDPFGRWLIYAHRSVRRGNLPSPVWDDYPFNVQVTRKLFEVDRLSLRGHVASSSCSCEFAFWSGEQAWVVKRSFQGPQEFVIDVKDAAPAEDLPVDAMHPLAIRVAGGTVTLSELVIERQVEYRLRPSDDRSLYPLRLGPDEWFLVGDNVPVSTDSRQWGPVAESNIIGRVQSRYPPSRRMVIPMP
jgi:type IV secretory pathway protease TraF